MFRKYFFTLLLVASMSNLAEAMTCEKVHTTISMNDMAFFRLDKYSQHIYRIINRLGGDTTSLRKEEKFVIETAAGQKMMEELQGTFGSKMKNRDAAEDGFANVTSTKYVTVAKYTTKSGEEKSVKVRFRKYYVKDKKTGYLTVAKGFEDYSWLEIKIQHPIYENAVTKLRLMSFDKDLKLFSSSEFLDFMPYLEKQLLKLNPKVPDIVGLALGYFDILYQNPHRLVKDLYAKTEYERVSYSIKIAHVSDPKKSIDVQITIDRDVFLTRMADRATFNVYDILDSVYEIKIPVEFAGLTPQNIAEYPGLARIKELVQWMENKHNKKFPMNKGKMSKIEKDTVDKRDKRSSRLANEEDYDSE